MIRTLLLAAAMAVCLSAVSATADKCKPGCRVKPNHNPSDCPWAFCRFRSCTYWKDGKKRWGHVCKPKDSVAPPPPPACANQCVPKWRDANKACDAAKCKVRGCPLGNNKWGFRCAPLPVVKPSPSASSSPVPQYPPYCPVECRNNRWRVVALCNPKICRVQGCKRRKSGKPGFQCVPLKPTPSPSPSNSRTPTPSPTPSKSPQPRYPPFCPVQCRRNWRRVNSGCDPAKCKIKNCQNRRWKGDWSNVKWRWGYQCIPKFAPTPSASPKPVSCGNVCYNKWGRANRGCNKQKCRVAWCQGGKWRCTEKW